MTDNQWNKLQEFRENFSKKINDWLFYKEQLLTLQQQICAEDNTPPYNLELPIVYNKALEEITKEDTIKLIIIGDNPGKNEQLFSNSKYLVGLAGKIGERFFNTNPELKIDFRKNVLILNKTPIHTAKTNQLKKLAKLGGKEIENLLLETQEWMAKNTIKLLYELSKENRELSLWLIGYSELKTNGIFEHYKKLLKEECLKYSGLWDKVFVFQHFSMNRFTIDLHESIQNGMIKSSNLQSQLNELGTIHKKAIFE